MNQTSSQASPIKLKGLKFTKSFAGIDEYQLDNGMKILLKPKRDLPALSWQVWYKVGSRNEQPNLTGMAHFLEHIMFKGTDKFGKGEIAQAIQLHGGIFNAFTSDDYTAYFENFSPENLELAIQIESDRMQNARIDHDDVELERTVIVSELEGNKNDPGRSLYETLRNTAYSVHTYRNPVIGYRADLDNINSKNMREFYENYYYPDNAVAVLVGNFDTKQALTLIQKYFGKYKPKKNIRAKVPVEPEQEASRRTIVKSGGVMKMLAMAFHIPEFKHEDSAPLSIISDIVFSGLSSRIYPKLVDAGLASSISGVPEPSHDTGLFRIISNLNQDADIAEVEKIIDTELEKIKLGATEDEINLAKAREESAFVYERDGVYDEGLQIGYFEAVTDDWTRYATWVDEVNKVTNEDIIRVAKKYFVPNNKSVVQLLPEAAGEALIDLPQPTNAAPDPIKAAGYGAAVAEPIDPKKLDHLLKITKPKYTKEAKASKLELEYKKLEGDVDLIFKEDHSLPLIYMTANFFAGSFADGDEPGLAYFTSQLLESGTKKKD
ncbi:MAG: pitrilysin family protein, partial [Candidatus Melainabacteria bacterium]|nr:pitrilysin family protein [Candidatus Melainabacteria bacterium]